MNSRMDKYNSNTEVPTRSDKNKELYKQIYNAYDEFENLVVPSNAKEIDLSSLKKEISSRDEYRQAKEYGDITNNKVVRKEIVQEEQKKENEVYDINELLNRAVNNKQTPDFISEDGNNTDYLKKLKLDNHRTNIEQVKELYDDIAEESLEEDESLLKTANLSLEILSDLKSENTETMVTAPIKEDSMPDNDDDSFYSNKYKFSKKDFDDKEFLNNAKSTESDTSEKDEEDSDEIEEKSSKKVFFKILLLVFGIAMVLAVAIYLFNYFNRV